MLYPDYYHDVLYVWNNQTFSIKPQTQDYFKSTSTNLETHECVVPILVNVTLGSVVEVLLRGFGPPLSVVAMEIKLLT